MDPYALQRRLTCILAADAVGYSKHMGQDEEGTIQVLAAHRAVIDGIIAFHRGRIVGTAGDSVLAEFTSAVEAVRCAVEIQDALRTRNDALPEHRRLQFRVGVNLGDVVVKDADLLGDGVNVAARLESLAEPGGICIASSVYDQITGKLDLGFQDIGEQSLKNITRPVRVYRVSGVRAAEALAMPAATPAPVGASKPLLWAGMGAAAAVLAGFGVLWSQGWIRTSAQPAASAGAPVPVPLPVASAPAPAAPMAPMMAAGPAAAAAAAPAPASSPAQAPLPLPGPVAVSASVPATVASVQLAASRPAPAKAQVVARPVVPSPKAVQAQDAANAAATAPARPAQPQREPRPPARTVQRFPFDGSWSARVACSRHEDGALGYKVDLVAQVRNGHLRAELGTPGEPGWLLLRGEIQPDGSAQLHAQGQTANPKYSIRGVRSGTPFQYDVDATFKGDQGHGQRRQGRICGVDFQRMQ
jgi:class 3 adenylate cyclase